MYSRARARLLVHRGAVLAPSAFFASDGAVIKVRGTLLRRGRVAITRTK